MKTRWLSVAVALLIAGIATMAVYGYVAGVKKDAQTPETRTSVLVAKEDIRAGTSLSDLASSGGFESVSVPKDNVVPGAATSLDELKGKTATAAILQGEQVPAARLSGGELPGGSLGIPKGFQAFTVALDSPAAANGILGKGDRVAVFGEMQKKMGDGQDHPFSVQMVPAARVLQVTHGGGAGGFSSDPTQAGKVTVTLALKAYDSEKVLLAEQEGAVWLGLLGPGDKVTKAPPMLVAEQLVGR